MDATASATLFAWLDREVWLVTAQANGRRGGLIATFVDQASIVTDLPRMLVGLARQHHTWELVEASNAFGLHLLSEAHLELVWRFGLHTGREIDKFAGLTAHTAVTGAPLLDETVGWLDCRVEARMETGDRTVYLGEVVRGQVTHYGPPLTAKQLMSLAPADKLAELKRQFHHDSLRDAEAIRQWRGGAAE